MKTSERYYVGHFSLPRSAAAALQAYLRRERLSLSGWARSVLLRELASLKLFTAEHSPAIYNRRVTLRPLSPAAKSAAKKPS